MEGMESNGWMLTEKLIMSPTLMLVRAGGPHISTLSTPSVSSNMAIVLLFSAPFLSREREEGEDGRGRDKRESENLDSKASACVIQGRQEGQSRSVSSKGCRKGKEHAVVLPCIHRLRLFDEADDGGDIEDLLDILGKTDDVPHDQSGGQRREAGDDWGRRGHLQDDGVHIRLYLVPGSRRVEDGRNEEEKEHAIQ